MTLPASEWAALNAEVESLRACVTCTVCGNRTTGEGVLCPDHAGEADDERDALRAFVAQVAGIDPFASLNGPADLLRALQQNATRLLGDPS